MTTRKTFKCIRASILTAEADTRGAVDPERLAEENGRTRLSPENVFKPVEG